LKELLSWHLVTLDLLMRKSKVLGNYLGVALL